jgi:hypothetical protein
LCSLSIAVHLVTISAFRNRIYELKADGR